MARQTNLSIFIVCEGSGTEPNYFSEIKDLIIAEGHVVNIRISPIPKESEPNNQPGRPGTRARQLKTIEPSKENELKKYIIPDEYKAQPTRYVKEAQMALEDGVYDEVWAVFDKDGHPDHFNASKLSKQKVNDKTVNIAFSSISFEYWVLLHFISTKKDFIKSNCRKGREDDRKIINCGEGIDDDDCKGDKCVIGLIKQNGFIKDYYKGRKGLFNLLSKNLPTAIKNAKNERYEMVLANPNSPIYDLNPYTDIDHLIYRLLNIENDYTWLGINDPIDHESIVITTQRENTIVSINIKNNKGIRFLLNSNRFFLFNATSQSILIRYDRIIIEPNETKSITLDLNEFTEHNPIYLGYLNTEHHYFIKDI